MHMSEEKMILRTEHLVKRYGKRTVVNDVSINVTQGEIVGLLGPNGAGKRLQPKTRWGINVCYPKGIVPILAKDTATTAFTPRYRGTSAACSREEPWP